MAQNAAAQETIFALREQVARLEGKALPRLAAAEQGDIAADPVSAARPEKRLSLAIPDLDYALGGGLPLDGMVEIRSGLMADAGSLTGFALSLAAFVLSREQAGAPVLWIGEPFCAVEAGLPYAIGIGQFGIAPDEMIHASPRKLEDALWLAETALASRALAAVVMEVHGNPKYFGLTESRRLSLRSKAAERPFLLLRQAGLEEASSASFRFLVEPAPAAERRLPDRTMLGGSMGNSVFRLTLEKSRNPAPLSFLLEWNPHDRQYSLIDYTAAAVSPRLAPAHSGAGLPASVDRQDRAAKMGAVMALERASRSSAHPLRRPA